MKMSVKKGDSVTLDTRLRGNFNHIQWRFGEPIIAESDRNEPWYRKDERFRDRLKLDNQTGSLTINNMRITDSGVYQLEIHHNSRISYKTFIVTVHVFGADEDGVKRVSVMEGDSVTLDTDLREKFNYIKWRFGHSGSIIAESDGNKISYPDESFRDRLKLNNQTGSLTINNMRITDSGVYHQQISNDYGTFNQTHNVTIYGPSVPDPGLCPGAKAAICVVVLLVLSAAAVLFCCCKRSKGRMQNRESVFNYEKQKNHRFWRL